ncbi:excisionase [Arthrobacter sp. SW1]|uniref:helix-turn-helix domain-containing protein n=1 Tax=Arthrobacter sp. SW1 TaxID=1920889 RepID=UPI000877D855|nr:helix-turn-helix domain-containing protein [Arthrobacter sp. SW1]OFI37680.1 excisionase [Arthrobacter sp. SW1]
MSDSKEAPRRFMTTKQAAEELNVGEPLVRSLLKSGELRGVQFGGRNLWRIEITELESYIAKMYEKTAEKVASGEFQDTDD